MLTGKKNIDSGNPLARHLTPCNDVVKARFCRFNLGISMSGLLQTETNTTRNRYPNAFAACASSLPKSAKILSFGCSKGDEVFTLAQQYFDQSTIVGVDLNHECLQTARSRLQNEDIRNNEVFFELSSEHWLQSMAPFDAIFAMSVLCLWPKTKQMENISDVFPYARFSEAINLLDALLPVGGILTIVNSNYSFEHTHAARNYETMDTPDALTIGFVKRFSPSGDVDPSPGAGVMFRKVT